jgi:hypothetical protein
LNGDGEVGEDEEETVEGGTPTDHHPED